MLQPGINDLLKKVVPIAPSEIGQYSFMLFGSGGFAKNIYRQYSSSITAVIEHESRMSDIQQSFKKKCLSPHDAAGNILIGSDIGNFQYNQIKALINSDVRQIDKILLIDPYIEFRNIDLQPPDRTILLLEHGNGVFRHGPLLKKFKGYFTDKGLTVTSLCPLTLHYYGHYSRSLNIIYFSGQRELYDIGRDIFDSRNSTYMEYGFFPQSEHFYLDKSGVSQDSSLMCDNLDWVERKHFVKLEDVRKTFLRGFAHSSLDYLLVPLQVPDDPNIIKCSRFQNGMQEFIDYIVDYYPDNQPIIFKPHPKDPNLGKYDYKGKTSSQTPFLTLLENASSVHGITSSTLYEAALAGVDVWFEGSSILAKHSHQKERLLAAMIDRQVSQKCTNFDYVLQNYTNLFLVD